MLRSGYRSGDIRPSEVVREIHRRIRDRGDDHVWIHLVPEEEAIARAEAVTEHLDLPLAGVPFAVKDNIDVAGLPTTAGCASYAFVPQRSARVVELLLDAGAVLIGKTNLDQFATGLVGTRSPYGAPASVYHPDFISGGSSSGSAVAVAAGLVTFALGTDTAGSGRVPAAFNNLVGLKPSRGLISTTGVTPACRSLDCVSILARDVADAEAVLEATAVEDDADPYARPFPCSPPFARPFRFGVLRGEDREFFGDEAAATLYEAALAKLTSLGGQPVEIDYGPFRDAAQLLYGGSWVAERFAAVGGFVQAHRTEVDPTVASIVEKGGAITAVEAFRNAYQLEFLRKQTRAIWSSIDFLALPTTPTIYRTADVLADPIELNSRLGTYTNFVNLLDLAAIAVPMGFRPDGLPLGVSFIAPAFSDRALCATARRFLGEPPANSRHPHGSPDEIVLAVVGAHLSGFPLNYQLTERGGVLLGAATTAPDYALYALGETSPPKPGLVRIGENRGVSIETELWTLTPAAFGSFVASVPPPLTIGTVRLADGRQVKGFLCEEYATHKAEPISAFGGWRNYLAAQSA